MHRPPLQTLLAAFVCLAFAAQSRAQEEGWRADLRNIDGLLRQRQYTSAAASAEKLARRMLPALGTGQSAAYTLAVVVAFRAIAEQGRGNVDDAAWLWDSARNIFAGVGNANLDPYGKPAAVLKQRPSRQPGPPDVSNLPDPSEVQPPEVIAHPRPVYPEMMRLMGIERQYQVETIIGVDGRPSQPIILTPVSEPAMAYVILDALRSWRFKPATIDGTPVPVHFILSVNFDIRH